MVDDHSKGRTTARTPIHPGEVLAGELEETRLSAKKLADVSMCRRLARFCRSKKSRPRIGCLAGMAHKRGRIVLNMEPGSPG
jgi:hypothetical protein